MIHDIKIPLHFDYNFYVPHYCSGRNFKYEDAYRHFITIGKNKGYMGSCLADRNIFVSWIESIKFKKILEIGPGASPALVGEDVSYFDVRKGEDFYEYARQKGVDDIKKLPVINYHSEDGSLCSIEDKFNAVFSSHCIEHTYDIVKHFNEVYDVLEDGGYYFLVVPDKRFCFDFFRNPSSVGNMVERMYSNIKYHKLNVFIDSLNRTHNDCYRHWKKDNGELYVFTNTEIMNCIDSWEESEGRNPGLHSWVFTDDSFHNCIVALYQSKLIKLQPIRVFNTPYLSNSFCAIMKKT